MESDPAAFAAVLGHTFGDRELLQRALTHKSLAHEQAPGAADNELLEFLGDAVLGFLVSEALVQTYPDLPEGRLSKMKGHLVSASHLYEVARRLDLGRHLLLGHGEEMTGGRQKRNLLSDAMEALIAALYLDGGVEAARGFVTRHVLGEFAGSDAAPAGAGQDYKSVLQETVQTWKLPHPRYHTVREHGPEHAKTFTVEVRVGQEWVEQADGATKKSAGQRAAQRLIERLHTAFQPSPELPD